MTTPPNQSAERMAAGGRHLRIRASLAAAIAHFYRRPIKITITISGLVFGLLLAIGLLGSGHYRDWKMQREHSKIYQDVLKSIEARESSGEFPTGDRKEITSGCFLSPRTRIKVFTDSGDYFDFIALPNEGRSKDYRNCQFKFLGGSHADGTFMTNGIQNAMTKFKADRKKLPRF